MVSRPVPSDSLVATRGLDLRRNLGIMEGHALGIGHVVLRTLHNRLVLRGGSEGWASAGSSSTGTALAT